MVAAAAVLALAAVPSLWVLPHDRIAVDGTLPLIGWFVLGVAGVIVIDRRPRSAVGWTCVASAAAVSLIALAVAALAAGPSAELDGVRSTIGELHAVVLVPLAGVVLAARRGRGGSRSDRRWCFWVTTACACTGVAGTLASVQGTPTSFALATTLGLGWVSAAVVSSAVLSAPRPVDEPLVDVGLLLAVVAVSALAGGLVRLLAQHERVFGADVMGAVAAAATMALAAPGAWWLREEIRTRRYGAGVLTPADVAEITADLRGEADPLELLAKAAGMVTATSASRSARIVLDPVEAPDGWVSAPLVVGDATVGTLLVEPNDPEGLELRQERIVAQLLPTIALVARAVCLAVDADHARADVALQREQERSRILQDLHDDLGPVLAGMGMRLAATRSLHPSPELDALADDLATCRSDLRRIVSGLTPPALADTDAGSAIRDLVRSFATADGPEVELVGAVPDGLPAEVAVTVYRTIAEGLSNALRHGRPRRIVVDVTRRDGVLDATIADDGSGPAVVVPGVGLTSLRVRAEELGGALDIGPADDTGTVLHLSLPVPAG